MTAGVQNFDHGAYLPPPTSISPSTSDAKGAGAPDTQGTDTQGEQQNFQSELQRQDTGTQETNSGDQRETGSAKTGSAKSGSDKSGSAKQGKKKDASADDSNPAAATPVRPAEPQKQVLPLVLALQKPDENGKPDDQPGEAAAKSKNEKQDPNRATAAFPSVALPATPDSSPNVSQGYVPPVDAPLPAAEGAAESGDPAAKSGKLGASSNAPASRGGLKLVDAVPPEPVAAAIQETVDSASSSPSALAFAARLSAAPQNAANPRTDKSIPESPSQPSAGSQTARIPVRYAATAQILQSDEEKLGASLKNDAGAGLDRAPRIDMVLARNDTARDSAPDPGSPAPQTAPAARALEIPAAEPPAAPPTSPHDIRVQVPDNNGGSTQVRFVESAGEVRVSVRTADEGLAQNLRSHLNDLTQRLADGGIPAEVWKPGTGAGSQSQNNQHQPDREGRGSGGQQSGGQGGQQDRQQKRPEWLEEMEASMHGAKA